MPIARHGHRRDARNDGTCGPWPRSSMKGNADNTRSEPWTAEPSFSQPWAELPQRRPPLHPLLQVPPAPQRTAPWRCKAAARVGEEAAVAVADVPAGVLPEPGAARFVAEVDAPSAAAAGSAGAARPAADRGVVDGTGAVAASMARRVTTAGPSMAMDPTAGAGSIAGAIASAGAPSRPLFPSRSRSCGKWPKPRPAGGDGGGIRTGPDGAARHVFCRCDADGACDNISSGGGISHARRCSNASKSLPDCGRRGRNNLGYGQWNGPGGSDSHAFTVPRPRWRAGSPLGSRPRRDAPWRPPRRMGSQRRLGPQARMGWPRLAGWMAQARMGSGLA